MGMGDGVMDNNVIEKTRFGNVKVSTRIIGLVIIGVLIVLGILGAVMVADKVESAKVARADAHAHVAGLVDDLLAGTLNLRRNEKDFLLRQDESSIAKHGEQMAAVLAMVESLKADPVLASQAAVVAELDANLHKYRDQFAAVVDASRVVGLTENDGLSGQLRKSVHQVEQHVNDAGLDEQRWPPKTGQDVKL
ncbi:MAG: hypothetical protein VR70_13700, partial [Rhodospirillaceae bacterium BRH_c57]